MAVSSLYGIARHCTPVTLRAWIELETFDPTHKQSTSRTLYWNLAVYESCSSHVIVFRRYLSLSLEGTILTLDTV